MFDSSPSNDQKSSGSPFGGSTAVQASAPANAPAPAPQAGSAGAGAPAGGGGTGGGAGGGAGGGNAGEAFGHFADGAGAGADAGGGGAGGGPASPEEAKAQSQNKPQPKIEQAPEKGSLKNSDDKGGGGGAAGSEASDAGQAGDAGKGQRANLPADITAAFPDANLSNVAVYLNSKEAEEQGVDGFANAEEIHVAPGADQQKTLRHEAAHVVQFRNGKKKIGDGQKVEPKEKNEQKAEKAEQGGSHSAASLGSAAPGEVRNKGGKPGTKVENMNEKGVPKVVFNGTEFKSVEGEFYKDLANADWDRQYLFDKDVWWRLPVFPAAGLYVRASSYFEPTARIAWKGTYKYEAGKDGAPGKFQVGATLEGELSAAITGALEGGAGLNLVIQKGGVGIEAALTAQAYAKMNKQINFWVDTKGNAGVEMVPLELDFGATIKGALSAVVWTRGWFSDKVKKWTLAEWVIATLAQYKTQVAVNMGTNGIKPTIGAVQGGLFKWGEAPALQ